MPKHLSIYPWAMDSEPAERLRNAVSKRLGYKVMKLYGHKGNYDVVSRGEAVVNWGRSDRPDWYKEGLHWLNHPDVIINSVDKLRSFECFKEAGVHHVPFSTEMEWARSWARKGAWIACRQDTKSYDGKGLVLAKTLNQIVDAPLYTRFIDGIAEFRAYVFRGKCIDLLKKFSEKGGANPHIRTDANGWNYTYNFHAAPEGYEKPAIKAIKSCGLDFGGVDLLWDGEEWWVLEVNTAPDINYNAVELFADGVVDWLQAL